MRFVPGLALLCLLCALVVAPVGALGTAAPGTAVQQEEPLDPASTTLTLQLRADGDAEWTVSTRFRLDDENDTRAFERLAADFETGDANVAYDADTFARAATVASNATGRDMSITDVRYNASRQTVDNVTYGRLALQLRWTNFAEQAGTRLRIGDAFNATDGTWLPGLATGQTLVIRPPEGYAVLNSPRDIGVENGVLRWEGPRSFEPQYLGQITYTGNTPTPGQSVPLGLLSGGAALVVAVATAAVVLSRRRGPTEGGDGGVDGGTGTDGGAGGAGGAAAASATTDTGPVTGPSDPELLSDEERIERLLERNGGRMKQTNIVDETGWSNAKVSQLLSDMAETDRVDKLRIGRENLISLPDEDVADLDDE
ncbi:hypothetical protein BRD04_01630 [Halobacteriales archaeon QS_9_67_17]|nr:MAG: hypothetical protein BRD04_01630 [Halobacteriales archaeon QS_9_67_17]